MRQTTVENMPADTAAPFDIRAPVLMDAALTPNRSLPRRGFYAVMAAVIVIVAGSAAIFATVGAWPVVGFLGVDVLLVWFAFRASYRSGRMSERVIVTPGRLHVLRRYSGGRERRWTVQTAWAQVYVDEPVRHESQVRLADRGRVLVLGAFLSPAERSAFAVALRQALDRANAAQFEPAQDSGGAPAE